MKHFKQSVLLLLLSSFWAFGFAQFTVNQNISFTSPSYPGCYSTTVTDQDGQWQGTNVTVDVTHNISSPTNPNIVANLNLQAYRYLHFDIYHDTGSQLQYVQTVSKYQNWLLPSSSSYSLSIGDLAGTPEGHTVIILRVEYIHSANSPHVIDLRVAANGSPLCSYPDFEGTSFECTVGQIDCFDYFPCGRVNVTGVAFICPIIGGGFGTCYEFDATIPNGSGNYTYYWNASHKGGNITGTASSFDFTLTNGGHPVVTLTVIDNVTGCVYHFSTAGKKSLDFDIQMENAMTVGPNPAVSGQGISVNFVTAQEGNVSISLYDLQGREVQRVYDSASETAGVHSFDFSPDVSAGIYLLGMRNADGFTTEKLLIKE